MTTDAQPNLPLLPITEAFPCPWCGVQPRTAPVFTVGNPVPTGHGVSCGNVACTVNPAVTGDTVEAALVKWNDRVPVQPVDLDVKQMERELILIAFKRFDGNRTQMSKALGIALRTLCGKLREFGYGPREKPKSE